MRVKVSEIKGVLVTLDDAEVADVLRHYHKSGQTATVRWIAQAWQLEGTEAFRVLKAVRDQHRQRLRDREMLDRIHAQRMSPPE